MEKTVTPSTEPAVPAPCPPVAPLRLLAVLLAVAPLVVLPAQLDFALLPQQVFIQAGVLVLAVVGLLRAGSAVLRRPTLRGLDLPLLAFLAWSAVSLLATSDREPGLRTLGHWLACGVVYLLVSRCGRVSGLSRVAGGALAGGAAVAFVGLAQACLSLGFVPQAAFPAATLGNRDLAAGYLVAVLPLALVAGSGRRSRVATGVAAVLILAFLPFTRSRGALLALGLQAAALVLAQVSARNGRRWRVAAVALTGCLALCAAALWLAGRDPAKARSLDIRRGLAESAVAIGLDRPLLGAGLGRFGALYPAYGPVVRGAAGEPLRVESPHDEPLQVFAETGLPGLLALAWLAGTAATALVRVRRSRQARLRLPAAALGLSLLGLATDAAFSFPLRAALPPLLAAVVLGWLAALEPVGAPAVARERPSPAAGWLAWAAGAAIAVALGGALALSLLRLAGDHALHAMRLAESEGRWGDALAAGRTAVRLDARPEVRLALARAELRLGHRQAALQLLRQVLAARPFEATAHATLGVARQAGGDTVGAVASLRYARLLGVGPAVAVGDEPPASAAAAAAACPRGLTISIRDDGTVDLSAQRVPLVEVLRCLSGRTGLRLDYEGPQPRQNLTLQRRGEPLPVVVEALFEGLGLNYVLSLDHAGRAERLIVVSATGLQAGSAGSVSSSPRTVSPPPNRVTEQLPSRGSGEEELPEESPRPFPGGEAGDPAHVAPPSPDTGGSPAPGARSPRGSYGYPSGGVQPDGVPEPEYPDPGQLSPTVLQLGPGPGAVKTAGSARTPPASADGT